MSTKHTPGPWNVRESSLGDVRVEAANMPTYRQANPRCSDDPSITIPVCDFFRASHESPKEGKALVQDTNRANAHMISAAPDLYLLVRDVFDYLASVEEGLPPGAPSAERFQFIIAKAEGKKFEP